MGLFVNLIGKQVYWQILLLNGFIGKFISKWVYWKILLVSEFIGKFYR